MTRVQTFLVFAYGSNMLTQRIQKRCPSASALGVTELHGYELRWHKRSRDGSGKCDVVETTAAGAVVYGVLYRIATAEKPDLDRAEELGNGYDSKAVTVRRNGESYEATIYFATAIDVALKPYTWYKALVVAGGSEYGLPVAYTAKLESTKAVEDPDRERHARNMSIVNGLKGQLK